MSYTKVGPFSNGSAAPPINAAFLNGVETALVGPSSVYWAPVPNGTDDTSALNTFIAGVPDYSTILFPSGTYIVTNATASTSAITVTHPVDLFAYGSKIIPKTGTPTDVALIGVNSSDVTVEGFKPSGQRGTVADGQAIAINKTGSTTPVTNVTVRRNRFDQVWTSVYAASYATDITVEDNTITRSLYGVLANDGPGLARWEINGNRITGNADGADGNGIDINGSTYPRTDFTITKNIVRNFTNTTSTSLGFGIAVANTQTSLIEGNRVTGVSRNGVHVEYFSKWVQVLGNNIDNTGNAGIEVQSGQASATQRCDSITISGNTVVNACTTIPTATNQMSHGGIEVGTSSDSNTTNGGSYNCVITDNNVYGAQGAGLYLQFVSYSRISGNVITDTYGKCVDTTNVGTAAGRNAGIYMNGCAYDTVHGNFTGDNRPPDGGTATQYYPFAFVAAGTTSSIVNNMRNSNLTTDLNLPSGAS